MCAGIQKNGIVFLKTKFHWVSQFRVVMMRVIGMGVANARIEPPQARIWVSVILWKVMNTGAKMPFMPTEIQNATTTFLQLVGSAIAATAVSTGVAIVFCKIMDKKKELPH